MTITQTVEIPEDRRVRLEFEAPGEVPTGRTSVTIQFPDNKEARRPTPVLNNGKTRLTRKELDEMLNAPTPISDSLTGILSGLVPDDITIEQIKAERLAKHLT